MQLCPINELHTSARISSLCSDERKGQPGLLCLNSLPWDVLLQASPSPEGNQVGGQPHRGPDAGPQELQGPRELDSLLLPSLQCFTFMCFCETHPVCSGGHPISAFRMAPVIEKVVSNALDS